jgi:DNA end-binding protein Ku
MCPILIFAKGTGMALRSMWKGSIRFSLVTIPVQAYTALEPDEGEIHLNQLHDKCHSRIRYQKTCPIHGEVRNDEIVTGYEYEKDHYVIVDRKEVDQAQADEHSIAIETFLSPEEIDPIYFDGRTYYLAPDKTNAERPYSVLHETLTKLKRWGLATVVMHGKDQLLLIRPVDGVLAMTMLRFKHQIRNPEIISAELHREKATAQELTLARQLIESSTAKRFDYANYEDRYTDRLKELIDAKIQGKQVIQPPDVAEEVPVINLMDALRKSVEKSKTARKALSDSLSRPRGQPKRRRKTS